MQNKIVIPFCQVLIRTPLFRRKQLGECSNSSIKTDQVVWDLRRHDKRDVSVQWGMNIKRLYSINTLDEWHEQ